MEWMVTMITDHQKNNNVVFFRKQWACTATAVFLLALIIAW
jgi:hypothetical protein